MSYQIVGGDAPRPSPTHSFRRPRFDRVDIAMEFARNAVNEGNYGDVVEAMESVALHSAGLTQMQGLILDMGYRKVMWKKCDSRRALESRKQMEIGTLGVPSALTRTLIRWNDWEMDVICRDAMYIIKVHALYHATSFHDRVFYHLLLADIYSDRCEFRSCRDWGHWADASLREYERAYEFALRGLPGKSPLQLKLAVSYTIHCRAIVDKPQRARAITERALRDASGELDNECKKIVKTLNDIYHEWFQAYDDEEGRPAAGGGGDEVVSVFAPMLSVSIILLFIAVVVSQ